MGELINPMGFRWRAGRRWIWSYLVAGSVACSGAQTLIRPASAADADADLEMVEENPGAIQGGWSFSAEGSSDFTYTDNVFLTDLNRRSDFIVSPRAALSATRSTVRTELNADVDVAYDYYTKNTRLNGVRPSALINGLAEIFEDTFTLEGRLATDVRQVSNEGRTPAIERNLAENQTQILNYGLSPTLRSRLGSGVSGEASYDFSGVSFLDPPVGTANVNAGDTVRHTGRARIGTDESYGNRLSWHVTGRYEHANVAGLGAQRERAGAEGRAEYLISAPLALVARGGYDWIEEPTLVSQVDGAYGLAGFIWRPSQRTNIRVEAGYRYRDFNAEADISYRSSERLTLFASYTRDIQTDQRLLLDGLDGIGRDALGNLIDPVTGLPPDPNSVLFDLTNQAFKRDSFRAGIYGRVQRNFYNVSGHYQRRTANGLTGDSWGIQGSLGRDITPRLQGSLTASHSRTKSDPGLSATLRDSETTSAGARLDYELGRTVRTSLRYVHMHRTTTLVRYRENAAILSLSKVF